MLTMKRVISFSSRSALIILSRQKTGHGEDEDQAQASQGDDTSMSSSAASAVGSMMSRNSAASQQSDLELSASSFSERNEVASVYCYSTSKNTSITRSQSQSHQSSSSSRSKSSSSLDSFDFPSVTRTLHAKAPVNSSSSSSCSASSNFETRYADPAPIPPRSSAEFDLHSADSSSSMSDLDELELPPAAALKPQSQLQTVAPTVTKKKARGLVFNEKLAVFPIPRTSDLTDSQRISVWGTKAERIAAMRRNAIEYAYEGMNWRKVLEEDSMTVVMGKRNNREQHIHPAHLQNRVPQASEEPRSSMHSTRTYLPSASCGAVRWHTAAPP
jgi:hypothetical protein